jgi:hypothetical protein
MALLLAQKTRKLTCEAALMTGGEREPMRFEFVHVSGSHKMNYDGGVQSPETTAA